MHVHAIYIKYFALSLSIGHLQRLGMNRLAIVADSPPWDLSGKWRLDCGANKTAYERRPVEPLD